MQLKQAVRVLKRRRHYLIAELAQVDDLTCPSALYDRSEVSAIEAVLTELGQDLGAMPDPKKYRGNEYYFELNRRLEHERKRRGV